MSDPSLALQGAIVARLKGSPPLVALIADRVFDEVKAGAAFPYLTIGDCQVIGDDDECSETSEVTFQIHAWSRSPADTGYPKIKSILSAVRTAMRAPLTLDGFDLLSQEFTQTQFLREPDGGLTRHAVIEFRFIIVHP